MRFVSFFVTAIVIIATTERAAAQAAASWEYDVDGTRSHVYAITHRAGLLSFLGHEHAILATELSVTLCFTPATPQRSTLRVDVPVRSLVIDTDSARSIAGLGSGPGAGTRADIAVKLMDAKRLNAEAYPTLSFVTTSLQPARADSVQVDGRLTLRGVTRDVRFRALVAAAADDVRLASQFRIKLSSFGIEPETVAGVVKVSNDVDLHIDLIARRTARRCMADGDATGSSP